MLINKFNVVVNNNSNFQHCYKNTLIFTLISHSAICALYRYTGRIVSQIQKTNYH